ncbi:MAG: septum formation protein Maf [Solirubrobacterales bacterium]|nr:septum formation protein Maf [Solirubrobacterales bacterium]
MAGLVLASASPRRRELLAALGIEFEVVVPRVVELREGEPDRIVLENARRKARAGLELWTAGRGRATHGVGREAAGSSAAGSGTARPSTLVLGVDTDVALDGRLLGKADDEAGARARLEALSGRTHEVLSGVCVIEGAEAGAGGGERTGVARTRVGFRRLDEREIGGYLASGEWRDRAGAYAIQGLGSTLVDTLQGDLSNVIGLPIALLLQLSPNLGASGSGARKP